MVFSSPLHFHGKVVLLLIFFNDLILKFGTSPCVACSFTDDKKIILLNNVIALLHVVLNYKNT